MNGLGNIVNALPEDVTYSQLDTGDLFIDEDGDVCMKSDIGDEEGDYRYMVVASNKSGNVGLVTAYEGSVRVTRIDIVKQAEFVKAY